MASQCVSEVKMAPRMSKRKHRGPQMAPKSRSREAKGGKKEGAGGRERSPQDNTNKQISP